MPINGAGDEPVIALLRCGMAGVCCQFIARNTCDYVRKSSAAGVRSPPRRINARPDLRHIVRSCGGGGHSEVGRPEAKSDPELLEIMRDG